MRAHVLSITAWLSLLFTCYATPPTLEQKLVGTWVTPAITMTPPGKDAKPPKPGEPVAKFVYNADHTYVASRSDQKATVTGTWKIESNYLITKSAKWLSKEERTLILRLTDRKLIFSDGQIEGHWWRSGTF
jgi:hypothetical protein